MAAGHASLTGVTNTRLSARTISQLAPAVRAPGYSYRSAGIGQVHLGVGAFMRAHTAVYTDEAMASRGGQWGIAGVSLRHATVRDQLAPQDCLYVARIQDNVATTHRLIGAIRSVDVAPEDPRRVVKLIADPAIRVITITVTEKGYCLRPESGALDIDNPGIAQDLDRLQEPQTMIGFLVAGLQWRRKSGAPPISIVSCDNLPGNGRRLEAAVREFAAIACPELIDWLAGNAAFPATMVDRIVPATADDDVDGAAADIGLRDEALVKTEPFTQWVIEDRFANDRPAWESGGAIFVDDVGPWESAKLRLLNGPHSAIAYLGYLGGCEYVHEAMGRGDYVSFVRDLMTREISPVTPEPRGLDHGAYIDDLLMRFSNASLRHRTCQIAMDGSQKLPQRLLETVRAQLRRGGPIAGLALAIAGWIRYALGRDEQGAPITVQDPFADRFSAIAALGARDADEVVSSFLSIPEIFGTDLASNRRFTSTVAARLRELLEHGAAATIHAHVAGGRVK